MSDADVLGIGTNAPCRFNLKSIIQKAVLVTELHINIWFDIKYQINVWSFACSFDMKINILCYSDNEMILLDEKSSNDSTTSELLFTRKKKS